MSDRKDLARDVKYLKDPSPLEKDLKRGLLVGSANAALQSEDHRLITVWERYYVVNDVVYREYSYDGKVWVIERTLYQNPPWTILDLSKIPTCVK